MPKEKMKGLALIFMLHLVILVIVMLWFTLETARTGMIKEIAVQLGGLITILLLGGLLLGHNRICILQNELNLPMLAWLVVVQVSFLCHGSKPQTCQYVFLLCGEIGLFFSLINTVTYVRQLNVLWYLLLACLTLCGIYGALQHYGHDFIASWPSQHRIPATFGNPTFYAGCLALLLPLSIGLVFFFYHRWQERVSLSSSKSNAQACSIRWNTWLIIKLVFLLGLIFLLLLNLYWTKGRSGQLAFGSAMVLFMILTYRYVTRRYALIIMVGLLFIAGVMLLHPGIRHAVYTNFFARQGINTKKVRLVFWQGTWRQFLACPIAGHGIGRFWLTFPEYRDPHYREVGVSHNTQHAHNEFLEIMAEMGLVGLAVYLWLLAAAFKISWRSMRQGSLSRRILALALLCGLVGFLVDSLASPVARWIEGNYLFYLCLALIVLVAKLPWEQDKSSPQKGVDEPDRVYLFREMKLRPFLSIYALLALSLVYLSARYYCYPVFMAEKYSLRGKNLMDTKYRDPAKQKRTYYLAIAAFEKSLSYYPYLARPYYRLGYLYSCTGDMHKALKSYLRLTALAPHYAQVHYNMAILYQRLHQYHQALQQARLALRFQDCLKNHLMVARILMKLKELPRAHALLEQAQRGLQQGKWNSTKKVEQEEMLSVAWLEYWGAMGAADKIAKLLQQGHQQACQQYQQTTAKLPRGYTTLNKNLQQCVDKSLARVRSTGCKLIRFYLAHKDFTPAHQVFEQTYAQLVYVPHQLQWTYTWIDELTRYKYYRTAEKRLLHILKELKFRPAMRSYRGTLGQVMQLLRGFYLAQARDYLVQQNYDQAAACCLQALQYLPRDHLLLSSLFNIYHRAGDWSQALRVAEEIARYYPQDQRNRAMLSRLRRHYH